MDRRGIAEVGGLSLAGGVLATAAQQGLVGGIDWVLVVGLVACIGIAAAANYQARTKHAAQVATEAPEVTEDNYEQHGRPTAGDGGVPPDNAPSSDDTR
ncbi:hypothetical protein HISP_00585 [Haloarcula hispanica N601]|uniref:Uncharacterized protein n=2 Tax=Haloarcula hispanica TaxID=51589 RepID=V5TIP1_HALHI|nr:MULTISPECIES: hypothetical protein [Haloarcula]AEM55735.1 conserved hypothetical protein [Haloarcula hispanica ATCC 33960]AHB64565.1 hypothetical protein HISP_00585 [Haloarcula hispanica N601]AJF25757.1 hypothetical protein SG26_08455 [Haloarcula sp. CBA1115]KAA9405606.1 hypothetical protein Har1131_01840 [Haloarcula sp. CBA1131]KZX50256.1 hypothetical protein AV929_17085 [Haloarcula sp. K1]